MNVRVCNNGVVVVVVMVLMSLDMIDANEAGPPVSVCTSMTPNHGADAQTVEAPYTITTSVTCYTPGQALTGRTLNCETWAFDYVKKTS